MVSIETSGATFKDRRAYEGVRIILPALNSPCKTDRDYSTGHQAPPFLGGQQYSPNRRICFPTSIDGRRARRTMKLVSASSAIIIWEILMLDYATIDPLDIQMQHLAQVGWVLATAAAFSMIVLIVFGLIA